MSQMQGNDSNSDDSYSDDDSPKRRRDLLTRRPSYHRILKDITSPDMAGELRLFKCYVWCWHCMWLIFVLVGSDGLHAIQTSGGGGTIQYTQSQDGQPFFVPGECIIVDLNDLLSGKMCLLKFVAASNVFTIAHSVVTHEFCIQFQREQRLLCFSSLQPDYFFWTVNISQYNTPNGFVAQNANILQNNQRNK